MDILNKLPVRSLLRFNCVSNFWKNLISEPYFKMKHLNHAKNNQNSQKILVGQWHLFNSKFSLYSSSLSSVQLFDDIQQLDCPSSDKSLCCKIYCCYDGLALIGVRNFPDKGLILLLWNPSTRESIVLPSPKLARTKFSTWGLGYDLTSDDFKILHIESVLHSEILALKSVTWRKINKHPIGICPLLSSMDSLAFVHGAFHWLGLLPDYFMVSFSISSEVYREILLPKGMCVISNLGCTKHGVSVLGGMLCVYSTDIHCGKYSFKLWVMKDYGVKESWNQLITIQGTDLYLITPKYRFSDGEVLFCCRHLGRNGFVFKTSKGSSGLWPQSDLEHIQNGFIYTESLISPKLLTRI